MSDLDLDVLRNNGRAWIEDEEEFEQSLRSATLPADFAEPARATANRLLRALQNDEEPFASVGEQWLRQLQKIEHAAIATPAPTPTALIVAAGINLKAEFADRINAIAVLNDETRPGSYETAAGRLGVQPDECVFVDDRLENVIGAAGVGMYAIHHTSAPHTLTVLRRLFGEA
jgi:HAD superfamily hydrolase (TIGR01509 family)